MARAKVGAFNTGTGTADVAVTDPGFTPDLVLFWWTGRTESVDTIGLLDVHRGFGWTIGTAAGNNRAVAANTDHGNANGTSRSAHSADACILTVDFAASPAISGAAKLKSFDSGGFTLQITDAFPADFRIHYWAIKLPSGFQLATGDSTEGTTANQSITAPNFLPDIVWFMNTSCTGAAPATLAGAASAR